MLSAGLVCTATRAGSAGVGEVMDRARRDPDHLALAREHPPAADPEPQLAREHGEGLLLRRMSVAVWHPPARGEHQLPLEHALAACPRVARIVIRSPLSGFSMTCSPTAAGGLRVR